MPPSLAEIRQLGGWEQGYPARSLDCSARGWVSAARGGGGWAQGAPVRTWKPLTSDLPLPILVGASSPSEPLPQPPPVTDVLMVSRKI